LAMVNAGRKFAGKLRRSFERHLPHAAPRRQPRLIAEQLVNERQIKPAAGPVAPTPVGSHREPDHAPLANVALHHGRLSVAESRPYISTTGRHKVRVSRERQPGQITKLRIAERLEDRVFDIPRLQSHRQIGRITRPYDGARRKPGIRERGAGLRRNVLSSESEQSPTALDECLELRSSST